MARKVSDVSDVILPEVIIDRLRARDGTETKDKFADGDDCAILVDEFGPRHGMEHYPLTVRPFDPILLLAN